MNDSLSSHNEALAAIIREGAIFFGATDDMDADEFYECARIWGEAMLIVSPIGFLEPDGVFFENGESGFFYDETSLAPGTPNAARILKWMQETHEILKAHFGERYPQ